MEREHKYVRKGAMEEIPEWMLVDDSSPEFDNAAQVCRPNLGKTGAPKDKVQTKTVQPAASQKPADR